MNFKFVITFIVIGLVAFVANARDRDSIETTKDVNVFILRKTSEKKNCL